MNNTKTYKTNYNFETNSYNIKDKKMKLIINNKKKQLIN